MQGKRAERALEQMIEYLCHDYAHPWSLPPPSEGLRPHTKKAAQAIQDEVRRRLGSYPVAWKLGRASEQDRAQSGEQLPITGWLDWRMVSEGPVQLSFTECAGTIVECEIALELGEDLARPGDAPLAIEDVRHAVAAIRPAMELPIIRFHIGQGEPVPDLLLMEAANSGSYKLVVGEPVLISASESLAEIEGTLELDGAVCSTGRLDRDSRADPLRSLTYLANNLADRGQVLSAGQIVTTGVNLAPIDAKPGRQYRFTLPEMGSVSLHILPDPSDPPAWS